MIHPILLCGGRGSRLWPSSRETFPKQFAPIMGDRSPFQEMLALFSGKGFDAPVAVTHGDFRFLAGDQAEAAGVWDARFVIEPEARGTAAAVLAAGLAGDDDPDALLLIAPVGHFTGSAEAFREAVLAAASRVSQGAVVRFDDGGNGAKVPAAEALAEMVGGAGAGTKDATAEARGDSTTAPAPGSALVLIRRADLMGAFEAHAPKLMKPCRKALDEAAVDGATSLLDPEVFGAVPAMDFETDVLERIGGTLTLPLGGDYLDLRDWEAVWTANTPDADGVATSGGAVAVDCHDSLLRCEEGSMRVLGVGLKNVVAVATRDAVLMADREHLDQIPAALDKLAAHGGPHAREYPRYHRPWGWYESLIARDRFQVKRIMVKPGGVLSLQSHVHRSEHWIVVGGTAKVTIDDEVKLVPENGSVYIPLGAVHRMANPGKVPMYLIEVQTGVYLGEDDIERYEDIYDRC